jgi:hypothetical protein
MYEVKVFIVQKANGELLGAKLTRGAAQSIARYYAPAKVTVMVADKQVVPSIARSDSLRYKG